MSKYVIHACPQRMWYVNKYLVPSMTLQGIENIDVCCDTGHVGCLENCMQIFKDMTDDGGAWHMQDDVLICRNFKQRTESIEGHEIICGFVTHGDGYGYVGNSKPLTMWWSFPCIYIPNFLARGCAEWYYAYAKNNPRYSGYTEQNKFDDAIFREYMITQYPNYPVYHLVPNLVDHIDYLIGGTIVNKQRSTKINRSVYFEDQDLVEELKNKLDNMPSEFADYR